MKILIVGTGYVGTTTGLVFSEMGHQVTGLDLDDNKIQALKSGKLHFFEPGLDDLLSKHVASNQITFTKDAETAIKENQVIFICVGTPQGADGSADLIYVKNVAETIGTYMNQYKVIVTKSTVPVGTADLVSQWVSGKQTTPLPFDVVSNPEFLREGSALHDALNPDRIVIGTTSETARKVMRELYQPFNCPILETNPKASEMIKYASNSFLATKISFINELARLCDALTINVNDVSTGMGFDHRIGPHFLRAGMGYGGSCFPKDVSALIKTAKDHNLPLSILESVVNVNAEQPLFLINKMKSTLGGDLKNKTIAVLGLAFKANTDDTRESPSLVLINHLTEEQAEIRTHDPVVKIKDLNQFNTIEETASGADAIVIGTDWNDYRDLNWERLKSLMKQPFIFDGRNLVDKEKVENLGFYYVGVANY
ncbi:UDP-glucose dehydrogenase family protein [Neobacillus cucumis]|uniref:UDP-glucose 6-dehydrogenase n=1 Tax=Neobacillus cucumis TaxID=1740721 RepID=A0A2N5H985_9BACI|nr:UDP-glucose/GDP-mannose dehydrogenase family protein [Neobacillus cucumis]PLS02075.1 nucleotide sugar dehydrogenase [Neobacillus cucumis]